MLLRVCTAILILMLPGSTPAAAQSSSVTLAWDASTEPEVTGYVVSWGTQSGVYTQSADVGNVTQWTLGDLNPDQRYHFVVQAYNSERLFSAPSNPISNDAIITQTQGTLADGRPGVFWHNQATGQLLTWHLSGTSVVDTRTLSIPGIADTNWRVGGVGDLNGDGHSDLVWRNAADGSLATWFLHENLVIGTHSLSIARVADANWSLRGVGDVNRDGYADLVWQHSMGRIAVWFMSGATVLRTEVLNLNVGENSRWQIATIGDLNRDGFADIVWQTTDGWLAVWLLQGSTVLLTKYLSIERMVAEWRIRAAGYPDGSDVPALVWRNAVTGEAALWYMNGATVLSTIKTTPKRVEDLNWRIVGSR